MTTEYIIRRAKPEDFDTIIDFLNNHFWTKEPMSESVDMIPEGYRSPYIDKWMRIRLEHAGSLALIAIRKADGRITGSLLANLMAPGETLKEVEVGENRTDQMPQKFRQLKKMLESTESKARIEIAALSHLPHVHHDVLGSDTFNRIPGLGTALFAKMVEIAWEAGAKWQTAVATSSYTEKIATKLGFKAAGALDYKEFKEDGEIVFNTSHPHYTQTFLILKK